MEEYLKALKCKKCGKRSCPHKENSVILKGAKVRESFVHNIHSLAIREIDEINHLCSGCEKFAPA
jgi:hypothetical protein